MNNPARTTTVRRTVLEALKHAQGYAVPVTTLHSHISALVRPPVDDAEWAANEKWLEDNKHIVRVESEMDADLVQFSITERGRVLLSTL